MNKNKLFIGALVLVIVGMVLQTVFSSSQRTTKAELESAPAAALQSTTCFDTTKFVDELNSAHAADPNNVKPVLDILNAEASKVEVKAGSTISNTKGFVIYWTTFDLDESRIEKKNADGVVVSLMGGGSGTVFAAYDTDITPPADGFYLNDLCTVLNPTNDLEFWPGFNPVPPTEVPTAVPPVVPPTAVSADCVDPDELVKRLNTQHTVNENDPSVVIAWLESLGVGTAFEVGDSLAAAQDSSLVWTQSDIDERFFERQTTGGTIVAYFGGSETILGLYDGEWKSPVDGFIAPMCDRVNPERELDYWAIQD
ncbi:hypothetical protein HY612_03045 [Candidatus Roizmanbacteria bacterium]|nr:hypothetical protein [Candidatus Roizmanbacteria bacterium]